MTYRRRPATCNIRFQRHSWVILLNTYCNLIELDRLSIHHRQNLQEGLWY